MRRIAFAGSVVAGIAALLALVGASSGGRPADARTCAVTLPNGKAPPGREGDALPPVPPVFHGNGKLWVKLWPLGVIVARGTAIDANGSIDVKLPWWRGVSGRLTITGRRLDAKAPPATARIPSGYGSRGFQSTAVLFPTQGCWRITGRVGRAQLTFVTLVVEAKKNGY